MSSFTRQQLEKWIEGIAVSDCLVLDVGGSQLPISKRITHKEATFHILDLEQPHEGDRPFIVQDLNEVMNANCTAWADRFDYAFCLEVSEYWYRPLNALRIIHDMLKKGGTLYISFHFVYPVHNPSGKDYLRYTRAGAVKLLEEAGFSVDSIIPRVAEQSAIQSFYRSEGMRPAKDYENHHEIGVLITATKL